MARGCCAHADGARDAQLSSAQRPEQPPTSPLEHLAAAAPLASIMASAVPAIQGAVQGAGDAVTLLIATGLPPLLRRLQQQQQQQQDDAGDSGSGNSGSGNKKAGRRRVSFSPLSARDLTTFRALALSAGEVGSGALSLGGLVAVAAVSRMSPKGPGCCDRNGPERWANVLTSLPYVSCGLRSFSRRRTPEGRQWGLSMAAVGAASMFFHASTGRLRTWGRRADYWCIAASSAFLCRALRPAGADGARGVPRRVTAASLLATPFRPFPVSTLNTLAMEFEFLRRAAANGGPGGQSPGLRGQQLLHSATAMAAMGFFALEEALPHAPFLHSSWHLLSSVSCATTNALLEDVERDLGLAPPRHLAAAASVGGAAAAAAGGGSAGGGKTAAAGRPSLEMYCVPLVEA